jgi:outer membrane protein assembly factor BamA
MLSVRPGDVFQQEKLYQTQRDLYAMGVFRTAQVVLADSLPPADPGDTLVRVLVQADEGPRHRVRAGLGYGTIECFRVQTGWTALDFLGGARALDITGRVSRLGVGYPADVGLADDICWALKDDPTADTLNYSLNVTLRQPVFFSPRHVASAGLFAERRSEFNAYTRDAIGLNMGVTFNARRTVPTTLSYGYALGRTEAAEAIFCNVFFACTAGDRAALRSRRALGAITLAAVRDRSNSPLEPTRGSIVNLRLMHASRIVGSDAGNAFNRGELEIARYHQLSRHTVFAWRFKAGTILPEIFTLSQGAARYVPPDQRFYAGGPNTVRGFRLNGLGPRVYVTTDTLEIDSAAALRGDTLYPAARAFATGGNSLVLLNAELRLPAPAPIPPRVRLGVFVDVGQVYERDSRILSLDHIRVTPGVGLRVTTPLGPVRLDVAYNGYAAERGTLFFQDSLQNLTEMDGGALYPRRPAAPASFWDRLVFQFAIGQAY